MATDDFDDDLLANLVQFPEKYFPLVLFESDALTTLRLLERLLLDSDNGHSVVIDCLYCWQDITSASFCLEPVISELQQSEDETTRVAALRLVNRLLQMAPSPIATIKIKHELQGIRGTVIEMLKGRYITIEPKPFDDVILSEKFCFPPKALPRKVTFCSPSDPPVRPAISPSSSALSP
ncbi:hypothetical protein QR680_012525 [Steinernema hermaphroditum]|uniref:Uncharacterized protein n=1 Tax=Steinernema hermaphroditum TaxID=289476 RepID=A0AA39I519_9BILA|nr:hypothetical protein QR680_012525 [Steinernema hermaphroditum]